MITILGNGPVGLIFERICQLKNWEHRLLGNPPSPIPQRLILLTPQHLEFLNSLGYRIPIEASYKSLRISSHLSKLPCLIDAQDYQQSHLCHAVWIQDLVTALQQFSTPTIANIISGDIKESITLFSESSSYESDLLIGSDGMDSIASKIAKISYKKRPIYHCLVIPAHIKGNHLIQKHFKEYIVAAIPHTQGSIILSSQKPLDPKISLQELQSIIGHDADIYEIKKTISFQLTPKVAITCFQNNTLLIGNAALTIEPITAQGLNHALSQLQIVFNLKTPDITRIAPLLNKKNLLLFTQAGLIASPAFTSLKQRLGFYSQLFLPLFQDTVYQLGNPNE